MNIIILAGGKGTRLRPLTFSIPKPLIPVGKNPILQILLHRLSNFGFHKMYLAVGYRAELIEAYFGDGRHFGLRLFYLREKMPLGTAGPIRLVRDTYNLKGPCLVLNADILSNINFRHLINWHTRNKADMTVSYVRYKYKLPYGMVEIEKKYIYRVIEKPILNFHISTGIYIIEQSAINLIPVRKSFNMPDLMAYIINQKMRLMAYPLRCKWSAIETIDDLENFYDK